MGLFNGSLIHAMSCLSLQKGPVLFVRKLHWNRHHKQDMAQQELFQKDLVLQGRKNNEHFL